MSGQKQVLAVRSKGLLSLAERPTERGWPVRHVGVDGDRLPVERRFPAVGGNPQKGFHAHWSTAGSALCLMPVSEMNASLQKAACGVIGSKSARSLPLLVILLFPAVPIDFSEAHARRPRNSPLQPSKLSECLLL